MNGHHIGILLPISILTYSVCVIIRLSIMLHPPAKFCSNRQTSDVISICQDGGHRVGNLLLSSGLVTALVQNGENLCVYQIWMRLSQSTVEIKLLPD